MTSLIPQLFHIPVECYELIDAKDKEAFDQYVTLSKDKARNILEIVAAAKSIGCLTDDQVNEYTGRMLKYDQDRNTSLEEYFAANKKSKSRQRNKWKKCFEDYTIQLQSLQDRINGIYWPAFNAKYPQQANPYTTSAGLNNETTYPVSSGTQTQPLQPQPAHDDPITDNPCKNSPANDSDSAYDEGDEDPEDNEETDKPTLSPAERAEDSIEWAKILRWQWRLARYT